MYNHYQQIDPVKSHNAGFKATIALEKTCSTRRCNSHVFAFLLDLSEVNYNLGENQCGGMEAVGAMLDFRRLFSKHLINNPYLIQDDRTPEERSSKRNKHNDGNILIRLPTG